VSHLAAALAKAARFALHQEPVVLLDQRAMFLYAAAKRLASLVVP
jgi:hypothetical protein